MSSQSGAICLDILKDQWTPVYTLKSTLMSLRSLLCSPEPSDPQDAEVAKHFTADQKSYEETAREWTRTYAHAGADVTGPQSGDPARLSGINPELVAEFTGMVRTALPGISGRSCHRHAAPPQRAWIQVRLLLTSAQNISKEQVAAELLRLQP